MSVNVTICAGARTDIEDKDGKTALQTAEELLANNEDDPERQQPYEKVHKDTHTITHFDIANGCCSSLNGLSWLIKCV